MINKVIMIGNLGADPEVRNLESGATVAKIRLATNESYRDKAGEWQTQTEWHDIVMWRMLAERAQSQLKKGAKIYVEGKLTHRLWDDKDGNKRKTTEVVANLFRLLDRREGSSNYFPSEEPPFSTSTPPPAGEQSSQSAPVTPEVGSAAEDDLPF